jgi:hypothetical protein
MATLSDYKAIIEDRPKKLDASDVDYREGEGDEICGNCIHFYRRVVDEYGVCELLRLAHILAIFSAAMEKNSRCIRGVDDDQHRPAPARRRSYGFSCLGREG